MILEIVVLDYKGIVYDPTAISSKFLEVNEIIIIGLRLAHLLFPHYFFMFTVFFLL